MCDQSFHLLAVSTIAVTGLLIPSLLPVPLLLLLLVLLLPPLIAEVDILMLSVTLLPKPSRHLRAFLFDLDVQPIFGGEVYLPSQLFQTCPN